MVIDLISNASLYLPLGPGIARALEFLQRTDLAALEPGRHPLDGDHVYTLVSEYLSKRPEDGRWEAHRRFVDLQCVIRGSERIGYAPIGRLEAQPYDEAKDLMRLSGPGEFLTIGPGEFVLLWPGDAHMPGIAVDAPAPVRKLVIKIGVRC